MVPAQWVPWPLPSLALPSPEKFWSQVAPGPSQYKSSDSGFAAGLLTALELRVRGLDTGVNNVDTGSGTSSAVVGVGSGSLVGVGDASKTPGGGALGHQGALLDLTEAGLDNSILLDGLDLFCVSDCHT
jgi:hypothetical protein